MRIPKYWERVEERADVGGRAVTLRAWGHSDVSRDEARRMAAAKLPAVREALGRGRDARRYDYFADPIREHRIEAWGPEGREHAVVTRNGYGALVLNTDRVMFVDIDVPPGTRFLFWGKSHERKKRDAVDRVRAYVQSHPSLSFRIYETAGGLRLVAVDKTYEPDSEETLSIMRDLGADPMYMRLCKAQKCFRARLSPKPWRIGCPQPPIRYPVDPSAAPYADWLSAYERTCGPFRVARLLHEARTGSSDGAIQEVLRIHDESCGVAAALGELA